MDKNKIDASLLESLKKIEERCKQTDTIPMSEILHALSGRGYPALLILFSLPLCFPITLPGLSTPFGIILGLIGLRLAFGKKPWWPQFILQKTVKSSTVAKVAEKTIYVVEKMKKIIHPRLQKFTNNFVAIRMHGILIFSLAILLSLPLPIPFTNTFSALPIFFLGLGLLEDDGVMIIIAYFLALICFLAFFFLFFYGGKYLHQLWKNGF